MTNRLAVAPHGRVIVDNDYQGDPDGLVALAHHLLSPANRVTAVTSSFLNPRFPVAAPRAQDGAALARQLLQVVGGASSPPVHAGSEVPFGDGSSSAASAAIAAEARRDDDLPLYVACGGPLTNVASALRDAPGIAARLTLIWIGGSLDSAAFEYNRDTDPAAAAFVFGQPELEIHQFPLETYRRCAYSVAELEHDLGAAGRLGRWLWEHFTNPPDWVRVGGVWPLGDSPPVLVTALTTESSTSTLRPPEDPHGRPRRVYTDVDFRLIVADMLARLRLHERVVASRRDRNGLWRALSSELELLVAKVGDQFEGTAESGDEPAQDVLSGDITALDLRDPRYRHAHPGGDLLLRHPAPFAHLGQSPAAGIVQHRGDGRGERLLAAGRLDGPL